MISFFLIVSKKIDLACYEDISGMVVGRATLPFMLPMLQGKDFALVMWIFFV